MHDPLAGWQIVLMRMHTPLGEPRDGNALREALQLHTPLCMSFHAHALIFSSPSVQSAKILSNGGQNSSVTENGCFSGRLLRSGGQSVPRPAEPDLKSPAVEEWLAHHFHRRRQGRARQAPRTTTRNLLCVSLRASERCVPACLFMVV